MKSNLYSCPATGSELTLTIEEQAHGIVKKGYYQNAVGMKYAIHDGLPDFTYPQKLSEKQTEQLNYYESNAAIYDEIQGLTFAIQNEDENKVRKTMVSHLHLAPHSKVLELSCGTGRDSENIAAQLNSEGELFVQDLSGSMLRQCQKKLANVSVPVDFHIGNASHLPFPSNYFDAVFSFGGLNVFDDVKRSLKEMVRVTKPNGRIVVGDESLPVWLYDSEFGKILLNANPLFNFKIPFEALPVEARDVTVRWIIGGVYYLISFTVGEGEPIGNFDIPIPGKRGGTLRTRYHGKLEGVSDETKRLVLRAAEKRNLSVHQWLDEALKSAAENEMTKLEETV